MRQHGRRTSVCYQSGVLNEAKRTDLAATYNGLNPVRLLNQINTNQEQLLRLALTPPDSPNLTCPVIRVYTKFAMSDVHCLS